MEQALSLSHFPPFLPPLNPHHHDQNPMLKMRSSYSAPPPPPHPISVQSLHFQEPTFLDSTTLYETPHAARRLHAHFVKTGDVLVIEKLVEMYVQDGDYSSASEIFFAGLQLGSVSWNGLVDCFAMDGCDARGLLYVLRQLHALGAAALDLRFLWNKLVLLHAEEKNWTRALEAFREMQGRGVKADGYVSATALRACGKLEALQDGKAIHAYVLKAGLAANTLVCNFLVGMYSKNAAVWLARRVFESMEERSLVSWNSMISCCMLHGFLDDAVELLDRMVASGMKPNLVTWNSLLSGYSRHGFGHEAFRVLQKILDDGLMPDSGTVSSLLKTVSNSGLLRYGKEIHGFILRHALERDVYAGTSLVDMYSKCGGLDCAQRVFDTMEHKNVPTWNSLISGYANEGLFDEALDLAKKMEMKGHKPDLATWNGIISGCSMNRLGTQAMLLIRQIKASGPIKPNVITWTALISGSCENREYEDCFYFFYEMQEDGVQPNAVTLSILLRACAALALLTNGAELHGFAVRKGHDSDVVVATALIDMYSKSGSLRNARRIFARIKNKNLVCWNSMIMGFAIHGRSQEAISLFHGMCASGLKPDGISFTALLSACKCTGLMTEGWKYFDDMEIHYGVAPTIEHYACMVDLLARGGYLDEAMDFIEQMPITPDAAIWGALLAGCRKHKNLELGEAAAKKLFKLEPYNSANYLLMMELYAYEKMWEAAESLKYAMHARGVRSRAGWSWIQIDETIHVFHVEGKPHSDIAEIYDKLSELVFEMRRRGYVPDTSCIVYDVGREEKEKVLLSHTEKLAITYGLINTDRSTPIRVIKNTRMCNDCHLVAKYISSMCRCAIILRDAIRFHHFVDGKCSCNDYW